MKLGIPSRSLAGCDRCDDGTSYCPPTVCTDCCQFGVYFSISPTATCTQDCTGISKPSPTPSPGPSTPAASTPASTSAPTSAPTPVSTASPTPSVTPAGSPGATPAATPAYDPTAPVLGDPAVPGTGTAISMVTSVYTAYLSVNVTPAAGATGTDATNVFVSFALYDSAAT